MRFFRGNINACAHTHTHSHAHAERWMINKGGVPVGQAGSQMTFLIMTCQTAECVWDCVEK